MNADGSDAVVLGGYQTASTPVVYNASVFFRGTDNKLWQIDRDDGANGVQLGNARTEGPVAVTGDAVYFPGEPLELGPGPLLPLVVPIVRMKKDGSGAAILGYAASRPVVRGGFIFFQKAVDNQLCRMRTDGTMLVNLGLNTTAAPPFVTRDHVYFRGTNDVLWRVDVDGANQISLQGFTSKSTPWVTSRHVWFQGTDDLLWRTGLDGSNGQNFGGLKTASTPTVDETDPDHHVVWFRGTDYITQTSDENALWRVNEDGSGLTRP